MYDVIGKGGEEGGVRLGGEKGGGWRWGMGMGDGKREMGMGKGGWGWGVGWERGKWGMRDEGEWGGGGVEVDER